MGEQTFHDEAEDQRDPATDAAITAAVPNAGGTQGSAGAFPDETMTPRDLNETEAEYLKRRAAGNAVDDNAAAHMGGMGSQGGQADFGSAGNLSGYDKSGL
jgi:hypothetical protein